MLNTTDKRTNELQIGDVVAYAGALFRLTVKHRRDLHVIAFETAVVDGRDWAGPRHWLADWIIQGNEYATWRVVADAVNVDNVWKD